MELKSSTNELELLAVVWACEIFRIYILDNGFEMLTDHKAIISTIKEHKVNKPYQSRSTCWADRLLPFDYEIRHVPGSTLGMADHLSQNPTFETPPSSVYGELIVIKTIENSTQPCNFIRVDAAMSMGSADSRFVSSISAHASTSITRSSHNGCISGKRHEGDKLNVVQQI